MKKLSISLTWRELLWGWIYLLFQLLILPYLLILGNGYLPDPLPEAAVNFLFFLINFLSVLGIAHRFLRNSLQRAIASPLHCLRFAAIGFMIYFAANILLSNIILYIRPDFANVNDSAISSITQDHFTLMSIGTVLLVPPVEEFLYRGLLFGALYNKNRMLAYVTSTIVFCGIHVIGYFGSYDYELLLLCFLQYIPAGICLGWAYAKADTILAPILMHIAINQIGMQTLR